MLSIVAYRCRVGCPGYSPGWFASHNTGPMQATAAVFSTLSADGRKDGVDGWLLWTRQQSHAGLRSYPRLGNCLKRDTYALLISLVPCPFAERAIPLLPAHKRQRGPWGWSPGYQPAGRGGKPARRPHWPTATACCAQRLVTCLEGASAVRVPALLLPYAGERPNRLWDDVQLWHHGGQTAGNTNTVFAWRPMVWVTAAAAGGVQQPHACCDCYKSQPQVIMWTKYSSTQSHYMWSRSRAGGFLRIR